MNLDFFTRSVIVLAILSVCTTVALHGQSPQFTAASIKPTGTAGKAAFVMNRGRVSAKSFPLGSLIEAAWRLQDDQLEGGPAWIRSEGFDVEAHAEGNPSRDQLRLMLRSLLAERFKLVVRSEVRERPVYELRLTRPDRKLGPSLRPSPSRDCTPVALSEGARGRSAGPSPCSVLYSRTGRWTGRSVPMRTLVTLLTRRAGRVVLDRTNLSGMYDFDLRWTDFSARLPRGAGALPLTSPSSFVAALEQELGLTLQPGNGPVDVIVIEHAEHPTPD